MKFFLSFRQGCLIAFTGFLLPAIASAQYTVTINLTAGVLYGSPGDVLPQGNLVLLIADTGTNGFGSFTPGSSLTAGSFLNGEDQIIGVTSIDNQSSLLPQGTAQASFASIPVGSGTGTYANLANGDPLAVVWFSDLTTSSAVLPSGERYGLFTGTPADSDQGDSWVIPPLGNSSIDLNFQTIAGGGSHPETDGDANLTAVPEPSTYAAIFGAAALGFAALRRSRRNGSSPA